MRRIERPLVTDVTQQLRYQMQKQRKRASVESSVAGIRHNPSRISPNHAHR